MNEKTHKVGRWMKKHQEEIVAVGIMAGVTAFYAGIIALAIKAGNKEQAEYADTMNKLAAAAARGATVLPGPDGMYWIMEKTES